MHIRLLLIAPVLATFSIAAAAQTVVRIGVLNDLSSVYADAAGLGSVAAAKMAVADSGIEAKGFKVEVLSADHQNKSDVGSTISRRWFDVDGVDAIVDVPNSGVALAVNVLAKEKNKVLLVSSGGTSELTGSACSPNTIHWTYDTWALANSVGKAITKAGGKTWYFLTADYAFGHTLEKDTTAAVEAVGGRRLGSVKAPLNAPDFSSFLLLAQASKAQVIGLANAGGDTSNSIKQAKEFGIVSGGQKLAGLLVFITDVHALGLNTAAGLTISESFYWDLNDKTRDFSARFAKAYKGAPPTSAQAGTFSAVLHYLKAVEALKTSKDGAAAVKKMKELPTDDPVFGRGSVRSDGRKLHPMYLLEVKKPSESKAPWDYYRVVSTVPASEAFRPLGQANCSLPN